MKKSRAKRLTILFVVLVLVLACSSAPSVVTSTPEEISIVITSTFHPPTSTDYPTSTVSAPQQPLETPNPTQTLQAVIDEVEEQFQNSNIAYDKPERMSKGNTADVELLLNPSLSQDALATKVTERGGFLTSTAEPGKLIGPSGEEVTIQTANIEITDKMRARLFSKDPNAFEIQERSELEQVIRPDNTTIWRWSVTANVEGPQTIELVLYRLIKDGDKEYWTEVESYRDNIVVEVSPIDRIKSWDWKWIIGIIVTAILIPAFWRWFDSKKKESTGNKKQPDSRTHKK